MGYCVMLQRVATNRDYLRREPDIPFDVMELTGWAGKKWTFVTFADYETWVPHFSRSLREVGFHGPISLGILL
jgi:hypothetical protein